MQNTRSNARAIVGTGIFLLSVFVAGPRNASAQVSGDSPDKSPWRAELCIVGDCESIPASLTAPANRNVVVDVFSGECSIANGGVFRQMRAVLNDTILHLFNPERAIEGPSHTIYLWNKQTRLVIPANGTFKIDVFTVSNLPDLAYCRFYLTGYTVKP